MARVGFESLVTSPALKPLNHAAGIVLLNKILKLSQHWGNLFWSFGFGSCSLCPVVNLASFGDFPKVKK